MSEARWLAVLAAGAVWFASTCAAWAAETRFCVAPSGDDSGSGTPEKPFATIQRAQQAVRAKVKTGLDGDVIVYVAGTQRLTEPLVFGSGDGGEEKHGVMYARWGDEDVVISGGVEITGWRDVGDGVWAAKVPAALRGGQGEHGRDARATFNELFVGDRRAVPARHPNEGFLRVDKAVDPRRSFLFKAGDIPAVKDAGKMTLVYLHDWAITRVAVESVDPKDRKLTTKYDVGCKANYWRICGYEAHPRYYLEGAREFLDAPGEWWLDSEKGEVLYRPMAGEKLEGFKAVAPLAKQLLIIRGESPDKPLRNLEFSHLTFEHCAWRHEGFRYAGSQAGFHFTGKTHEEGRRGAMIPAVDVRNARHVRLTSCMFRHLGGAGIRAGQGCRDVSLQRCGVSDVAGTGVMLGEPSERSVEDGLAGANAIYLCRIEACGQVYHGAVGVWVGLSDHNRIWQNEVCHMPYTGISVGWRWNPTPTPCKGNIVHRNHIHHVMQVLSDGGGIYTLGRQPGTKLTCNWIHDVPVNAGRAESNGMFLDEGSTDLLIEGNLIHDIARSPLRFHKAGKNLVTGNVLVHPARAPTVRYNATPQANIALENNETPEPPPAGKPVPGERAEAIRKAAGPGRTKAGPQ